MARIAGIRSQNAGLGTKLVYYFTRRNFARLTGRTPGRLEPLEVYAHVPGLLRGPRYCIADRPCQLPKPGCREPPGAASGAA